MQAPLYLTEQLQAIIPNATLVEQTLPETAIKLWLMQPNWQSYRLNDDVLIKIWENTPYWVFCWASGLAMAQMIFQNPELVKDKVVCDFGAGSGVVAIASKMAGAKTAIACDIDVVSLKASEENAKLNGVEIELLDDLYRLNEVYPKVDVLIAADVLYDQSNRFFLDEFLKFTSNVWVADSRVKNFVHPNYFKHSEKTATTCPDLDESSEFRNVSFYKSL